LDIQQVLIEMTMSLDSPNLENRFSSLIKVTSSLQIFEVSI